MEEYDIELESISPEEFDLENFEYQVQREIYQMLDLLPLGEQVVATIKREDIPKKISLRSRVLFYIKSIPLKVVPLIFAGVMVGFLLARGTSITLATVAIYGICCLGFLFALKRFLDYREEQARRARQADWERRQAEEDAKRRISQLMAGEIVDNPSIRKLLCPSLKSITSDIFEISKMITPVLTGAVIAGTIAIPLNPMLIAAVAFVIARSGVNSLCADYK